MQKSEIKTQESIQNDIICGRFEFNSLPSLKPRIIRIFLCSPYKGKSILKEIRSYFT